LVLCASLPRTETKQSASLLEEKIPWQVASKVKADLAIFSLRLEREIGTLIDQTYRRRTLDQREN